MPIDHALTAPWRDDFILSAECRSPDARSRLYRGAERGKFTRVALGVFLPTREWTGLSVEERHRARVRAIALTHPGAVFSHYSAAIIWQIPLVDVPLSVPHLIAPIAEGGRSKSGLIRHCRGLPESVELVDGLRVTGVARTVVDVAAVSRFSSGVVVADYVLSPPVAPSGAADPRRVTWEQLQCEWQATASSPGSARARRAIAFADGASGSPGESISRAAIHELGLPKPVLQQPFFDGDGLIGYSDFWWPDADLIGEFDGVTKYIKTELTKGRTPGEVVSDEKRREDRLRAQVRGVARWGWSTARSPGELRRKLIGAGLRPERAPRRAAMSRALP
jgi:hypothetical protein